MRVFRSRDWKLIWRLATDPAIFPHISDDFTKRPEEWAPIANEQVIYLVAWDDAGPFGFGIFVPSNWVCYSGHFGFLPRSYGAPALEAFATMLAWMWQNTLAARIVGEIRSENRRALSFAKRVGFQVYGVNPRSILRGGILRDQVALGISRPE